MMQKILDFILETLMPTDPLMRRVEASGPSILRPRAVVGEYAGAFYLASYKNPLVRTALIEIKNRPNKKIAGVIGKMLFEALANGMAERPQTAPDGTAIPLPLILPIPITGKKKRKRGWNQCELILDGFIEAERQACKTSGRAGLFEARKDILIKSRENADQVGMSRAQRFENLKDCFAVPDPRQVSGRSVVVFDDILTTGATFGDARRALAEAGAAKITCIAIAH